MSSHLRHGGWSVALSNEILWLLSGNSAGGRHLCEIEKKLFLVLMWLDYPNHPQGWNGSLVHFLTFLFISNRPHKPEPPLNPSLNNVQAAGEISRMSWVPSWNLIVSSQFRWNPIWEQTMKLAVSALTGTKSYNVTKLLRGNFQLSHFARALSSCSISNVRGEGRLAYRAWR